MMILTVGNSCKNLASERSDLKWLTIAEADQMARTSTDKKFIVDVYTDWCHWCKVMDQKTFTDPELIKFLNENFIMVKFNAEQKEPIKFKGTEYQWQAMGRNGVNALALELLRGDMGYPSLVYLNEKLEPISVSPGYKTPEDLMNELKKLL